jgi:hypothetical protein
VEVAVVAVAAFDVLSVAGAGAVDAVFVGAAAAAVVPVVDVAVVVAAVVAFPHDDHVKTAPTHLPSVGATWAVHAPGRSSSGSKGLASE